MSLYNMINGVNPASFFVLPMLGHHPKEYPRFRDCFAIESSPDYNNRDVIELFTRTGGGNREAFQEQNDKLTHFDTYITNFDNTRDSTYASFIFSVPDKWQDDFSLIINGDLLNISKEYKDEIYRIFPKLTEQFDILFQ